MDQQRAFHRAALAGAFIAALLVLPTFGHAADFAVTNLLDSGSGSLRRAVRDANTNPGADTISIEVTGQIHLTSGSIDIMDSVTISGSTADTLTVDGGGLDRVLTVGGGVVVVNGLTLQNGRCDPGEQGGGINLFGGSLELRDCAVLNSFVPGVLGDERNGGGIRAESTTTLIARRCLFAGNIAESGLGGAIRATGNLVLENCTFSANTASEGGALVYRSDGAQTAMVDSCTFVGNAATVHSGGIRIGQGLLSIRNTIVANNAAPIWADVDGVFTSLGHNLIRSIDGSTGWAPSDKLGVDPLVGPLADNGGPTLTHALRVGSPALDSADPFQFPLTDQRGASRPKGPLPDIGAYEKAVPQNQPPVADAGPDQSLPYYGSPVTATLDGTGSSDPEGLPLGYTWYDEDGNVVGTDPTVNLDLGAGVHTFRLVVEDAGGLTDEDDVAIEVVVVDEPPVADAGPDQSFLYSGSTVSVTLDGSGSIDPEGGALLYAWYDGNGVLVGNEATVDLDLGPGAHTFRLVVEDEAGQTDEDEVVILHQDPAAPTITGASASPTSLWPPNHKMRTIRVSYAVSDDFDTSVTTWLTVESSEADSGLGSGDVPNDVRVVDANTLLLRAERFAKAGRTYTITIHAMDDSGHETIETLKVQVPHSNKKPKKTRR